MSMKHIRLFFCLCLMYVPRLKVKRSAKLEKASVKISPPLTFSFSQLIISLLEEKGVRPIIYVFTMQPHT